MSSRLVGLALSTLLTGSPAGAAPDDLPPFDCLRPVHAIEIDLDDAVHEEELDFHVQDALDEFQVVAETYELRVFACNEPPVLLFTEADPREAWWIMTLMVQGHDLTQARIGVDPDEDPEPVVGFHLREQVQYEALLEAIAAGYPYLASWIPAGKRQQAFTLYQPAVFAVLEDQGGGKMDHRDNLIVNSSARLALHSSHGVQPFWVREAVGLDAETTLLDKLYGFSGSDEFVPTKRPSAWRTDVGRAWKKARPTEIQELFGTRFEDHDRLAGLRMLGLHRWLAREHPAALPALVQALEADRHAHLREDSSYTSPAETQWRLLGEQLPTGWETDALKALGKPESKSKSKAKVETALRKALGEEKKDIGRRAPRR